MQSEKCPCCAIFPEPRSSFYKTNYSLRGKVPGAMCIDHVTNMIPITDNLCLIGNALLFLCFFFSFFCILWEEMMIQRMTFNQKRQTKQDKNKNPTQTGKSIEEATTGILFVYTVNRIKSQRQCVSVCVCFHKLCVMVKTVSQI